MLSYETDGSTYDEPWKDFKGGFHEIHEVGGSEDMNNSWKNLFHWVLFLELQWNSLPVLKSLC